MMEQDKYNKIIQDKLNEFEFEYNAADWNSLSKQLPKKGIAPFYKVASIFVGAAIIALGAYYFNSDQPTKPVTAEKIAPTDAIEKEQDQSSTNPSIEKIDNLEGTSINNVKQQDLKQETKQQKSIEKKGEKVNPTEKTIPKKLQPASDEKSISIESNSPKNELVLNQTAFCLDDVVKFETKTPLSKNQVIKINGEAVDGNEYITEREGEYNLSLFEGDKRIDSKSFTISSASKSNFIAAKKSEEFAKITYNFESESNSEIVYTWFINGTEVANKADFNQTFSRESKINVTLSTKNNNGCKSTTTKTIQIEEDFNIYSYDAFTPNGDGINDAFIPKAIEANNLKFEMTIYSLSGQILYSTSDYTKPWNGRRNNDGEMMTMGTYLWKVNLYDDNNEIHPYNGQIKIVNLK